MRAGWEIVLDQVSIARVIVGKIGEQVLIEDLRVDEMRSETRKAEQMIDQKKEELFNFHNSTLIHPN